MKDATAVTIANPDPDLEGGPLRLEVNWNPISWPQCQLERIRRSDVGAASSAVMI
jgi:hypothetical protein